MKGKIIFGILMLFLVLGFVSADMPIAGSQSVEVTEDVAKVITLTATHGSGEPVDFDIDTVPLHGALTGLPVTALNTAQVTYTPNPDYNGADSFKFKVSHGVDTSIGIVTINVVNAQPVINVADSFSTAVGDTLTFTVTATDVDNDVLTLSADPLTLPTGANFPTQIGTTGGSVSQTFTWTPKDEDTGSNTIIFSVTDGTATVTKSVEIIVGPEDAVCDEGPQGDLRFSISSNDLDEDEYLPGEIIDLEVDVDNNGNKDLDVIVEATLFDVSEDDELDEFESDEEEIKDGDDNTFDIELEVPLDGDLDEDGEFIIFVKAFEDREEDTNCDEDSIEVDIEREDNDVVIESISLTPSSVRPGDTVQLSVDVLNVGSNDQDDVTVEIVGNTLGIDERSESFNLDRATDNDDDFTERFLITIPNDASSGSHNINVRVLDEDEDVFDVDRDPERSHDPEEFVTLTVSGGAGQPSGEVDGEISLIQTSLDVKVGDSFNIPVIVKNTGSESATFVVETSVTPSSGWSLPGAQTVVLDAGQETTVFPTLSANVDAGSYNVLISLQADGNIVDSETLSVNVKGTGTETVTGGATGVSYFPTRLGEGTLSTVFFIIGDVALIVIIIYFISLLFRRRR